MDIDERKKVVKGISVTAVLGVIATVVGILANIHDLGWFEKEKVNVSSVKQEKDYAQPVIADDNLEESAVVQDKSVEEVIPPVPAYSYTKLCDLEPADKNHYYSNIDGMVKDTVGNTYTGNVTKFNSNVYWSDTAFATYYLGGKYKILTGTIAINEDSGSGVTTVINILGDDNILYTTGEIDRVFAPVEFSIDVEGVQWLRIDNLDSGSIGGSVSAILYDWQLE